MFKTRGGGGGQRPFEQCSKKHPKWYPGTSLTGVWVLEMLSHLKTGEKSEQTLTLREKQQKRLTRNCTFPTITFYSLINSITRLINRGNQWISDPLIISVIIKHLHDLSSENSETEKRESVKTGKNETETETEKRERVKTGKNETSNCTFVTC